MSPMPVQKKPIAQNHIYLRKLPVLDFIASLYSETNLENIYIICTQHLMSTTYSLFHAFLQLDLEPYNLSAVGKCYSIDPPANEEMKKGGTSSKNMQNHCFSSKEDIKKLEGIFDSCGLHGNYKKITNYL